MRKLLLAATLLSACSTSVPPTNPYDAQNPGARAPVAVTVSVASDDPLAEPGWVSCAPATATPCRVNVTLTSDASPTELQLSADPGFAGASWVAVPLGPQPWSLPFDVPAGADGPVTVHARLRSAAGNVSATFSETIQRKSSAPAAPAVELPSLVADGGAYYTNALLLPLSLSAGGADRMRLSCDATAQPLSGEPWIPFNPGPTCVLVAGNGDRVVSAVFADEAGNVSSVATTTVRLQQTPPPPPVVTISTGSGTDGGSRTLVTSPTTALTSSTQFVVAVDTSAAGALFSRVDASSSAFYVPTVAPGSVTFTLAQGDVSSQATNTLTLRTLDKAGNASLPAIVTVVHEPPGQPAAPAGVTLFTRPGSLQIGWQESVSRYVAGYELAYGPTSAYGGTGADQGASPVHVGRPCDTTGACRYVLTGLSNFQPVWVRLTAVSELQQGAAATAGPATPQPAGLTFVGRLSTGTRQNLAVALQDDRAYVVQNDGLQIVDLADPANPVARGRFPFDAAGIIPAWGSSAVVVRWPHAYVAGYDGLYVFDVRDDTAPPGSRVGKYRSWHPGVGAYRPVVSVALRWPRAYLHVQGRYYDVGALLDVVDVSNPAAPVRVTSAQNGLYGDQNLVGSVAVVGTTAFLGTVNNSNLTAWDVSLVTSTNPVLLSTKHLDFTVSQLAVDAGPRRLVYALERNDARTGTLRIFDYTNPAAPADLGIAAGVPSGKFALAAGDLFLAAGTVTPPYPYPSLVEVMSVADPTNPRAAGTFSIDGSAGIGDAQAVAVSGTQVLVAGSTGIAVLDAAHRQYPQARGQAPTLGLLTGGGRVELAGRLAVVPGNGVAVYDVGDPEAPRLVASNDGSTESGSDYKPGYGYAGGAALSGDLVFHAYGTYANSGTGLVAFDLGLPTGGPSSALLCGIARTPVVASGTFYNLQAERYLGLSAHGKYLFAARGGLPTATLLDVFDVGAFASRTACAYQSGFAAGPAAAAHIPLLGVPTDVQAHQRWAFVAETDGFEVLDAFDPLAAVSVVHQATPPASAIGVRRATCAGAMPCYRIFLATDAGVLAYTWLEGTAAVTAEGALTLLGGARAVLAADDLLVQGDATSGGLGFFDTAALPARFQSYSRPQPAGAVYAIGAAGRYVYASDGGAFVVQELQ